jgi:hypothetical protein
LPAPAMIFYSDIKLIHDDITQIGLIRDAVELLIEVDLTEYFSCVDDQEPAVFTWQYGHMMVGAPDVYKKMKLLLLRER